MDRTALPLNNDERDSEVGSLAPGAIAASHPSPRAASRPAIVPPAPREPRAPVRSARPAAPVVPATRRLLMPAMLGVLAALTTFTMGLRWYLEARQ